MHTGMTQVIHRLQDQLRTYSQVRKYHNYYDIVILIQNDYVLALQSRKATGTTGEC